MEIVKYENVPVKALPQDVLDKKVEEFGYWVSDLLSLTDMTAAKRLDVLLPMIKELAWSMPLSEIKKAFEKYAWGQLPMEPMDNYLTPILFSKVITAYKQQRKPAPVKTELPQPSEEEIKENALANIMLAYDHWKEHSNVPTDYAVAFDRLYEWGLLPDREANEAVKKAYHQKLCQAHLNVVGPILDKMQWSEKEDLKDTPKYKEMKKRYHELNDYNHPEVQARFRCLVLAGYFKKTDKESLKVMVEKALA